MEYTFYVFLLFFDTAIALGLAYYSWQRRQTTGARVFFWFMIVTAWWSVSSGIAAIGNTPEWAIFWQRNIRFIPIALVPVVFLVFVMEYAGYEKWLQPRRIAALLIIPLITQIIIQVKPEWFSYNIVYTRQGSIYLLESNQYGFWFFVHAAYSYLLTMLSLGLLVLQLFVSSPFYRRQTLVLIGGVLVPFVANIVSVTRIIEFPEIDLTSIAFTITGIVWAWALFRFNLITIMPIAHEAIVRSMDDAVVVLDTANHVVQVNPAAEKILGQLETDIIGQSAAKAFVEQRNIAQQFVNVSETETEITLDDKFYDLRISTVYRRDQAAGRLVVLRDITARKHVELERERLINELNAYAHTVAHDLKNPLGVITGAVDFINMNPPEDKKQQYLETIGRVSHKMVGIIDALLLLASVRGTETIETTILDMGAIVTEVQSRYQTMLENVEVILPETWPAAIGYRPWIEQVWANYISNAVKYGGTPPRIELGADHLNNNLIHFRVSDNGTGLNKQQQAALFRKFSRLEKDRAEGHGLGLSIVQRIIERLGGTTGVESTVGEGSTFYFTLPEA